MIEVNDPQNVVEFMHSEVHHPKWDEPVICRVEVDLPSWLEKLAGGRDWEVCSEAEEDHCVSFVMRQRSKLTSKITQKVLPKVAEVTLYHNGYAVVDVEGKSVFDGSLTSGMNDCAHLTYYHADTGEKITLN